MLQPADNPANNGTNITIKFPCKLAYCTICHKDPAVFCFCKYRDVLSSHISLIPDCTKTANLCKIIGLTHLK